jgi:molecular chaperone GrpE
MEEKNNNAEETRLNGEQITNNQIVEEACEVPHTETPEEVKAEVKDDDSAKIAELNDRYLRLYSEFDNYKKRTARERVEFAQMAGKEFFLALLPVIDDFERAKKSIDSATDINAVKEGVDLIYNKFIKTLTSKGLEAMQTKESVFDADLHEAITNIPAPAEELKGKVLDEVEKGYYLNGKVIRFAKVVVGN